MVLTLMLILGILLILGFPLAVPLLGASIVGVTQYFTNVNPIMIVQQLYGGITPFVLQAIPMFILAADIMAYGQTSRRLLDLVGTFVGHIRGGYAITTALACTLFGAISGSSQATVAAVGRPMRVKMLEVGYKDSHAMALIVNAADVALLVPPSIGMIMYAVVTGTSVSDLFLAGVVPGVLISLVFSAYSYFYAKVHDIPLQPRASWRERFQVLKRALYPLGFPVIILGGIYAGIFTPTEAAAVSVLYALILELFVFRSIRFKDLHPIAVSTGLVTAVIFLLVAAGKAFSWVITYARIPHLVTQALLGPDPTAFSVLLAVTVSFFIACMFVDQIVAILVLAPIFYPVAMSVGIDPIVLGIIISIQVAVGSSSPPFGVDIFTASAAFNRPYFEIVKGTPPFMLMLILVSIFYLLYPDFVLVYRYFLWQ